MSPVEPFEREENIVELVSELSGSLPELDEATIDGQFLFRFELGWCAWVKQIRQMIWGLLGEDNNIAFSRSNDEHLGLVIHLEKNKGVGAGVGSEGLFIGNNGHGYRPFNKLLCEWVDNFGEKSPKDREEIEQGWAEIWGEANQVSKIHSEIQRIGLAYNLIPHETEFADYSPKRITSLYWKVFNWIMWERTVPSFRWSMTRLLESRFDKGWERTIRPHMWPKGHWQNKEDGGRVWIPHRRGNTKRMTLSVRIRTWAIYFLTKRGGGERTEASAVDLWNQKYPDYTTMTKNFRNERKRLFDRGSKKSAQNDNVYPGLSF